MDVMCVDGWMCACGWVDVCVCMWVCRQMGFEQLHSRNNYQLIAGRFGHVGVHRLSTNQVWLQLTKAYVAETSCDQLLIDTDT